MATLISFMSMLHRLGGFDLPKKELACYSSLWRVEVLTVRQEMIAGDETNTEMLREVYA